MHSPGSGTSQNSGRTIIFYVLFAGFLLGGIVGNLNGPLLPTFISRWSMTDSIAGTFISVMYFGSLIGTFLASLVTAAKGFRPVLVSGFALIAVGIFALRSSDQHFALAATALYGFGYGCIVPATNLWVAENSGARSAAALNFLNFAWGIGAMTCPLFVLWAIRIHHLNTLFVAAAIAGAALAMALLFSPFEPHKKEAETSDKSSAPQVSLFVTIALAILFFVYVGTELSVSGWAATHAKRVLVNDTSSWALAPTIFFVGLLSGRGLASVVLLKIREGNVVFGGLLLAAFGMILLIRATNREALLAGCLLSGLGLSGLYPIYVAWLSKWFGVRARKVGGVMFALAAMGGTTLPWVVGKVSDYSESLRVGLCVPLAGALFMLVLVFLLRARVRA